MKIIVDMNLSPEVASMLSINGHDAVHWGSIGSHSVTDSEIMAHAAERGQIVITNDLDFGTLLAHSSAGKPSVVQTRFQDLRPAALVPVLLSVLNQFESELETGALITVSKDRNKVRLLPL